MLSIQIKFRMVSVFVILALLFGFANVNSANAAAPYTLTDLGALGGYSYPVAINEAGQVIGNSTLVNGSPHAFVWEGGVITDLGTLDGDTYAVAINEAGQVIGTSTLALNGYNHAFVWEGGVMTDLGTLGGSYSSAAAINEAGQVIGTSTLALNGYNHAFVWESGVMTDLGTLGGYSSAVAINEAGQVIGTSTLANGRTHSFVWEGGVLTDLGTLGGDNYAFAINEAGQVIGTSTLASGSSHAFVWEDGVLTDLGTLGGSYSYADAINETGQVIGTSYLAGTAGYHAFMWEGGVLTDLGTLGGYSYPVAINEAGQVIGTSTLANGRYHAFVWEDGVLTDLGTLGGIYSFASAINEAGQVIGHSHIADNTSSHAFVATSAMNQPPTVGAGGPYSVNEGGSVQVTATGNDPENGSLTYTWDLDNNGSFETPGQTVTFSAVGLAAPDTKTIQVQVTDEGGLTATDQADVTIIHNFSDFLSPVDPLPTFNAVKAGASLPVRFSLSGDQGLNIFAAGYPKSEAIPCDSNAQVDGIEETVAAGNSNLSYDPATDTYTYVWKTNKLWANTCRQLVLQLDDGTFHQANFNFTK